MTKNDLIRLYAVFATQKPHVGRDPSEALKAAQWWVDRLYQLFPEEERKGTDEVEVQFPIPRIPFAEAYAPEQPSEPAKKKPGRPKKSA